MVSNHSDITKLQKFIKGITHSKAETHYLEDTATMENGKKYMDEVLHTRFCTLDHDAYCYLDSIIVPCFEEVKELEGGNYKPVEITNNAGKTPINNCFGLVNGSYFSFLQQVWIANSS